ncbi:MAG: hypothetical protein COA40_00670 [Aequorivita sp.]|nr:MAG: hypothetical protein COA40_00670 [Aequorivita sp.]
MARVKSLIKVEGTLDDITYYKSQDGFMARKKGGVSKNRIAKDPAFARTRENGTEFGEITRSGKYLRRAINGLLATAKDNRVTSRLTQVLSKVKNEDLTSARGQRNVATGIASANGKAWLNGFNFNTRAHMDSVLLSNYTLDTATGEVIITDLNPDQQIAFPGGATHITFTSGFLNLDFTDPDGYDLQLSPEVNVPITGTASTVTLTPAAAASGTGESYYFLKIAFFQEVNGIQYVLNNGAHNALQLIEIL